MSIALLLYFQICDIIEQNSFITIQSVMFKEKPLIQHTIPPLFDENSKILILGSFPSVKSREAQFFYGHPQNRFWPVMAALLSCKVPETIQEKMAMILGNRIALWDVIAFCDIEGSDDASIRNVIPNDLRRITEVADIKRIFTNGGKSYALYNKYCLSQTGMPATRLPSSSPANAGCGLKKLIEAWRAVKEALDE